MGMVRAWPVRFSFGEGALVRINLIFDNLEFYYTYREQTAFQVQSISLIPELPKDGNVHSSLTNKAEMLPSEVSKNQSRCSNSPFTM